MENFVFNPKYPITPSSLKHISIHCPSHHIPYNKMILTMIPSVIKLKVTATTTMVLMNKPAALHHHHLPSRRPPVLPHLIAEKELPL
jgi:hypothetical protein